jgi:hypothetical protein
MTLTGKKRKPREFQWVKEKVGGADFASSSAAGRTFEGGSGFQTAQPLAGTLTDDRASKAGRQETTLL